MVKNTPADRKKAKTLSRVSWADIRERVQTANPVFCALMDTRDSGNEFDYYLAAYDYGRVMGNEKTMFIPTETGDYLALNEPNDPRWDPKVLEDLSYGANSAPLCMLLNKSAEFFIDRSASNLTLPCRIFHAGDFMGTRRVLDDVESNTILHGVAGCRSAIMLPPISCTRHFTNVQNKFGMSTRKPENLYEHGKLFAELAQHPESGCDWILEILFFSRKLIQKIKTDPDWSQLRIYFYTYAMSNYLGRFDLEDFMHITLSEAQRKRGIKVDPYHVDTLYHLYKIAVGLVPGFAPASDETYLPRAFLQRIFVEIYGLEYYPTLLHPSNFDLNDPLALSVYYSRQYPTTFASSPETRKVASIVYGLGELQYLFEETRAGLDLLTPNLSNAVWLGIGKNVDFQVYHSHKNQQKNVQLSRDLPNLDTRFGQAGCVQQLKGLDFCEDGAFMRGCISIRLHQNTITPLHPEIPR